MRTLVTGGRGNLGRVVVRTLLDRGHEVVDVDRAPVDPSSPAEQVVLDAGDPDGLRVAMRGCTGVVHFAAYNSPEIARPADVFGGNVQSSFAVLRAAADVGVRTVVLASSASALGMAWARASISPVYAPVDEDHPLLPADPYGLSKQVTEVVAAGFTRETGLATICLRFPWTVPEALVLDRVRTVAAEPSYEQAKRDLWAYALPEDVATAASLGAESTGLGAQVFNVMAPDTLSAIGTGDLMARFHPTTRLMADLPGCMSAWSTDRIARVLGFRPARSWRHFDPIRFPHQPTQEVSNR